MASREYIDDDDEDMPDAMDVGRSRQTASAAQDGSEDEERDSEEDEDEEDEEEEEEEEEQDSGRQRKRVKVCENQTYGGLDYSQVNCSAHLKGQRPTVSLISRSRLTTMRRIWTKMTMSWERKVSRSGKLEN